MSSRTGTTLLNRVAGRGRPAGRHIRERETTTRERIALRWKDHGVRGIVTAAATAAVSAAVLAPAPAAHAWTSTTYKGKVLANIDVRRGPTTAAIVVGSLNTGATVTLLCKQNGEVVDGNPLWYKLGFRQWAAARYISNIGAPPPFCPPSAESRTYKGRTLASLNIRRGPTTASIRVGGLHKHQLITLLCKQTGQNIDGNPLWYKLGFRQWVTARYVANVGPAPKYCVPPIPAPPSGKPYLRAAFTERSAPSLNANLGRTLPANTALRLRCKVYGGTVNGNSLWYKESNDEWVTAYYVNLNGTSSPSFCGDGNLYRGQVTIASLAVRSGPNSADRNVGSVSGNLNNLVCKVNGDVVDGNPIWYELTGGSNSGGRWVAARYVTNVGSAPPAC